MRASRGETVWNWPWGNDGTNTYLRVNTLNNDYFVPDSFQHFWPDGTNPVGFYNGENGTIQNMSSMGCYDMIGNVWEWLNDPIVFNNELRYAMGASWDWEGSNSGLKWTHSIINTQPNWSTGFRIVKDN